MKDFDSNRIYQILGDEFKNIYIVDCEDQQIHTFKEHWSYLVSRHVRVITMR